MWEQEIFFENFQEYTAQIPCESKISRTVREIEANLCFAKFLAKIQNAAIFGEGKIFFKIANSTFLRYPVGQKFRRNRSISHGY